MFAKKFLSLVLALTVTLQPFAANALNLVDAFGQLTVPGGAVSTNDAGRYTSSARSGFTAGGLEVRIPRSANAPQLLSITPPRISAGCNGISAHFGGFSFISGAEFGNMIKQIASGAALGFVSSLVMKTLCPACQAVVAELKAAAQAASRLAIDGCAIGKDYADKFQKGLGGNGDSVTACAEDAKYTGAEFDSLTAYQKTCKTIWAASAYINSLVPKEDADGKELKPGEGSKAMQCTTGSGNMTWFQLSQMDGKGARAGLGDEANVRKLMLINLMGADMAYVDPTRNIGCDESDKPWVATEGVRGGDLHFCKPKTDTRTLTGFFMCGATLDGGKTSNTVSSRIQAYCRAFVKPLAPSVSGVAKATDELWVCKKSKGGPDDYTNCDYLELVPANQVVIGDGFLVQVNNLLREGVKRVRDGTPFYSGGGPSDEQSKKIIALINAAPYPLYQVINAAAVYPAAADELIDSMSVLVAEQFAYAMFDEMMRLNGRSGGNACMSRQQATHLLDAVGELRSQTQASFALIAQHFSVQQGISEQIRQVNQSIQRQVLSQDLLSTGKLSETLNRAITGTGAGAPSAAPAP